MSKFFLLFGLLFLRISAFSQNINEDINHIGEGLSNYLYGYSETIVSDFSAIQAFGHEASFFKKEWRVKYGLSSSFKTVRNIYSSDQKIQSDNLYLEDENISYLGNRNGVFGATDPTIFRKYLSNSEGERILNPKTGEYLYVDVEMPGGLGYENSIAPSFMPYLSIRAWKGLVLHGGYIPHGLLLNEFDRGNFKSNINQWSYGASLHMNHFVDVPVVSWLYFQFGMNEMQVQLSGMQDILPSFENEYIDVNVEDFSLDANFSSSLFKLGMVAPINDKIRLLGSINRLTTSRYFGISNTLTAKIDTERLDEEYGYTVETSEVEGESEFVRSETGTAQFQWVLGASIESEIASVTIRSTNVPFTMHSVKFVIRIF